jgi:prevent-host-death family protein
MTHMHRVGIRALQQNAAAVVAKAAAGEGVEITDRGRPVARLLPIMRRPLDELIAAGLARPARASLAARPPVPRKAGQPTLGELLADARGDER